MSVQRVEKRCPLCGGIEEWCDYADEFQQHIKLRVAAVRETIRCTHCDVQRETKPDDYESRINFAESHRDCKPGNPFGNSIKEEDA